MVYYLKLKLKNMKKIYLLPVLAGLLTMGCSKELDSIEVKPLVPVSNDAEAGTWKLYLGTVADYAVKAPSTSADYTAELATAKSTVAGLSAEQKTALTYWQAGSVARWNEIARRLLAKYNLPPEPNEDGTYPVPSSANPDAYPLFPFANPPYASRALALLSVAQYDALVATWNYKFKYNRNNNGDNLPDYPSEEAVVAAASAKVLKFLFPRSVETTALEAQAQEAKMAGLWAGKNVQTDIDAGMELGSAVADKVIAYAKTDGMGAAAGNPTILQTLSQAAVERGNTAPWKSLDIPARPGMLMQFGNVKTWNFDKSTKEAIRPTAPPAVGSAKFNTELDEVRKYADNTTREQWGIIQFWADGLGSTTPPGHWNKIAVDLLKEANFSEVRFARTMALMNTAVEDAGIACWDAKYYYFTARPNQIDGKIKTATGTPNFPSFTSGHSTFSAAAATVLTYVFPTKQTYLEDFAKQASESRIMGCIHFRSDCEAGLTHGKKIGEYAVARGKADGAK